MRTCDAAVLVLRETKNTAVGQGDDGLIHAIAERAGLICATRSGAGCVCATEQAVLNALTRQPGELVPGRTLARRSRLVRVFFLREHAPEWALKASGA